MRDGVAGAATNGAAQFAKVQLEDPMQGMLGAVCRKDDDKLINAKKFFDDCVQFQKCMMKHLVTVLEPPVSLLQHIISFPIPSQGHIGVVVCLTDSGTCVVLIFEREGLPRWPNRQEAA